jgi:integrase/recombinase XerD
VTRLRKMMLEELERRNYSAETTRRYMRFVERFAQHFGKSPDKLGPDDLRSYQAYLLRELKLCPGSVENHVAALRFFYVRTLRRHEFREFLPYPKSPRKLPSILSQEEVERLISWCHRLPITPAPMEKSTSIVESGNFAIVSDARWQITGHPTSAMS